MEGGAENPSPPPPENRVAREVAGRLGAKLLVVPISDRLRKRIEALDIRTRGQEHLLGLEGSFLIAANHIKPSSPIAYQFQMSPDAFVIEHEVEKTIGRRPRIVAKSDDGWWGKSGIYRKIQEKTHPVRQVVMKDSGFIPVMMNPGSFNKTFVEEVNKAVEVGDPIIIFPEGHWYDDFDIDHDLKSGAATIALKHNLPVIPAYIRGASQWKKGQKIDLVFGEVIQSSGMQRDEITEEIRNRIANLQQTV